MNIICLDAETTGTMYTSDELLQVSIITGDGRVIFNEYCKPLHTTSWPEAEQRNGISPNQVKNCKPFHYYQSQITKILSEADVLIGYNIKGFDLPFLSFGGINMTCLKPDAIIVDIMLAYAPIHGTWMEGKQDYKWQKLQTCAKHYGYKATNWHNSLDDAKATLFCFHEMFPNGIPKSGPGIFSVHRTHIPAPAQHNTIKSDTKKKSPIRKHYYLRAFLWFFFSGGTLFPVSIYYIWKARTAK